MTKNTLSTVSDHALNVLVIENQYGRCEVSLFGGHVMRYVPAKDNRERLWMSPNAIKDGVAPLRGGIPVCWPWFSDRHGKAKGELPSHGFLRNQLWSLVSSDEHDEGTQVSLAPSFTKAEGFTGQASVRLIIDLSEQLSVSLETTNDGNEAFNLGGALHSYFDVDDITDVQLEGLFGEYEDKTQNFASMSTPSEYRISGETDRIHKQAIKHVLIKQSSCVTEVNSSGHDSVVVWNPWTDIARNMKDMNDDGYRGMVCVETALTQGFVLEPGQTHRLVQIIS